MFRISHASGSASGYRKSVEEAIRALSELIARFPNSTEIPRALFARAKSFTEIGRNHEAKRDYLTLIRNHPSFEMLDSARMAVAGIDIAANDHAAAIAQLREVEKNPESAHYPFALHKLAWSYLNLKAVSEAVRYLEKHIRYYAAAEQSDGRADEADAVSAGLAENSLSDLALFYLEGFEASPGDFPISRALPYFRSIAEGPRFGKLLASFAKLLGAHNHYHELVAWKSAVLEDFPELPEASEITLLVFDYQFAHRDFASLASTTSDLVSQYANRDAKAKESIREALIRAAKELQELVLKNKSADEVQSLAGPLSKLYNAVVEVLGEHDPRGAQARLNLAETLFQVKDFAAATAYYRWIVANVHSDTKEINLEKISLEAIASRYEELKGRGAIPGALEAKAIPGESQPALSKESPLSEWVAWIDTHEHTFAGDRTAPSAEFQAEFENFQFEAARALYAAGLTQTALERMRRLAFERPNSRNAVASISLILDSYVKSRDWDRAHDLTRAIAEVKEWEPLPLAAKAFEIGADTSYKIAEGSSREDATEAELRATLKSADACAKRYARSARHVDCLVLAGKTALLLKDVPKANAYFTKVIEDRQTAPHHLSACVLLRASIKEDEGRIVEALEDLQLYLGSAEASKDKPKDEIVKKILHLAWLSGDAPVLKAALEKNSARAQALKDDFDRGAAFLALKEPVSEEAASRYFKKAYTGSSGCKSIWALAALSATRKLPFQDRLVLIQRIGAHWNDLDPADQLALVAELHQTIPRIVLENRKMLGAIARVAADQSSIERRLRLIKEVEQAVAKVLALPWAALKAAILDEHAEAYLDFTRSLKALKVSDSLPPEELKAYNELLATLIRPLNEKAAELQRHSLELALESGPAPEALRALLEKEPFRPSEHGKYLALWRNALKQRNFPLLFELAVQAEAKFKFSKEAVRIVKALSLYFAGAKAEGLAVLRENQMLGARSTP
ncbi:MAG: tetratricopeptide repeat protein [Deltaproteobacteria bacterium]|nr:tetratricopeptide repeat protein [Deltaproteobacteria bacterium]